MVRRIPIILCACLVMCLLVVKAVGQAVPLPLMPATEPFTAVPASVDTLSAAMVFTENDSLADTVGVAFMPDASGESPEVIADPTMPGEPLNRQMLPTWLFWILLGQIVLLAILRAFFYRDIMGMFSSFFNINIAQQFYRDSESILLFSALLLNVLGLVSLSIYLFLLMDRFLPQPGWNYAQLYLSVLFLCTVLYMGRYLLFRIVTFIFPFRDEAGFFNFNFFLALKLLGVLLLPLNLLIAFGTPLVSTVSIVVSLLIITPLLVSLAFRGFLIGKNYLLEEKFHFFLYICTLELAPLLVLLKLIGGWVN